MAAVTVCLYLPSTGMWQQQWDYALSNFQCDGTIYVVGPEALRVETNVIGVATFIDTVDQIPRPAGSKLVVLAPQTGRYVVGDEPLAGFVHPTEAIYVFGPDNGNLSTDELGAAVVDHRVYVPTDTTDEMYSFVAFAVAMWDRRSKGG